MGGGSVGCKLPWVAYKPSYVVAWARHGACHACPLGHFINQYPGTRYTVDDVAVRLSCQCRVDAATDFGQPVGWRSRPGQSDRGPSGAA